MACCWTECGFVVPVCGSATALILYWEFRCKYNVFSAIEVSFLPSTYERVRFQQGITKFTNIVKRRGPPRLFEDVLTLLMGAFISHHLCSSDRYIHHFTKSGNNQQIPIDLLNQ